MNSTRIIQEQINQYRNNFLLHKDSPLGMYWNDRETQQLRFEMLTGHLLREDVESTIEDVGCGVCDMYAYLKGKNLKVTYSGTEIINEMLEWARERYPELTLKNRDIIKDQVNDKYDFVVLSGAMNLPGNTDIKEWRKFCFSLIQRMFEMCNKAIAFNFLTTHSTFTDPALFYLNPTEAVTFCLDTLSRFVELRHNYALYEGTITVYRENYIKDQFTDAAFAKYFERRGSVVG